MFKIFYDLNLYLKFERPLLNYFTTTPLIISKKRPTFSPSNIYLCLEDSCFIFFGKHFRSMSSKYSIFVDELMRRIIFVVDILRDYADSKNFWRQCIMWLMGVHIANILK